MGFCNKCFLTIKNPFAIFLNGFGFYIEGISTSIRFCGKDTEIFFTGYRGQGVFSFLFIGAVMVRVLRMNRDHKMAGMRRWFHILHFSYAQNGQARKHLVVNRCDWQWEKIPNTTQIGGPATRFFTFELSPVRAFRSGKPGECGPVTQSAYWGDHLKQHCR